MISVIIPVYNVEKYLEKCLDSVCEQTFNDLEIILVDDGSTDGSATILDQYAKKDHRIKVYHKQNGGASSARNYGIERSSGEYIGFVDSDDYIEKDMYEVLYNNLVKHDADMSLCGLFDMFDGKPRKLNDDHMLIEATAEETVKIVLEAEITSVTPVDKLYKRELFNTVRYPEGKISEDAFIIIDLIMQCKKTVITTDKKYYYVHRAGSTTTLKFCAEHLHVLEAYERNYRLVEENYPDALPLAKMRLCWAHFNVLDKLIFDKSTQYQPVKKGIVKYIRSNYCFIMKNKQFTKARKLSVSLLMISEKAYRWCVDLQNRRYRIKVNSL